MEKAFSGLTCFLSLAKGATKDDYEYNLGPPQSGSGRRAQCSKDLVETFPWGPAFTHTVSTWEFLGFMCYSVRMRRLGASILL